jgi:hypothetical protein
MVDFQTMAGCERLRVLCSQQRSGLRRWVIGTAVSLVVAGLAAGGVVVSRTMDATSKTQEKIHSVETRIEKHVSRDEAEAQAVYASLKRIEDGQKTLTDRVNKVLNHNGG